MKTILLAITTALAIFTAYKHFSGAKMSAENMSSPRLFKSNSMKHAFDMWRQQHNRSYGVDTELAYRQSVFESNYNRISAHNASGARSRAALNKFADLTPAEFKAQYTGLNKNRVNLKAKMSPKFFKTVGTPDSYDAREDGLVNAVKDQGQCGSCWAFSTVGAIEGQRAKAGLGLQSFAEQQLVDCAPSPNQGCNGGDMGYALDWVTSNPLALESAYPYTARDGTCNVPSETPGAISSYGSVAADASQIRSAIYTYGAVSVAIEADQTAFQFYDGGVIDSGCGDQLDHGVTGVGYGNEDGTDYFLIRNSWGASWGESGYVKIATNQCGVMNEVNYAIAN